MGACEACIGADHTHEKATAIAAPAFTGDRQMASARDCRMRGQG